MFNLWGLNYRLTHERVLLDLRSYWLSTYWSLNLLFFLFLHNDSLLLNLFLSSLLYLLWLVELCNKALFPNLLLNLLNVALIKSLCLFLLLFLYHNDLFFLLFFRLLEVDDLITDWLLIRSLRFFSSKSLSNLSRWYSLDILKLSLSLVFFIILLFFLLNYNLLYFCLLLRVKGVNLCELLGLSLIHLLCLVHRFHHRSWRLLEGAKEGIRYRSFRWWLGHIEVAFSLDVSESIITCNFLLFLFLDNYFSLLLLSLIFIHGVHKKSWLLSRQNLITLPTFIWNLSCS